MTTAGDGDDLPPELRAAFAARLERDAGRVEALRDGLAAAEPPLAADPRWSELGRLAHGLAGVAGTYGFPDVGAAAADLERLTDLSAGLVAEADASCRGLILAAAGRLLRHLVEARSRLDAGQGGP